MSQSLHCFYVQSNYECQDNIPQVLWNNWCFLFQGQGVLSERLRSFSMQDLSIYQSEATNTDSVTPQPAATQQRTRTMMRSKSESYNKGEGKCRDLCLNHTRK